MKSTHWMSVAVVSVALASGLAAGQATILGGLSNFDCYNETETECDEFEFELEGPHPEDVFHTYRNWNYGSPTIRSNPSGTGIIVTYSNPQHPTAIHGMEHFGVSLRNLSQVTGQRFTWKSGTSVPPGPPTLPVPGSYTGYDEGEQVLFTTVTNVDDRGRSVWVQRKVIGTDREVSLEELMVDDPLVDDSDDIDLVPVLLAAGQTLTSSESISDVIESSLVFSFDVYQNDRRWIAGRWENRVGALLGNVMNAAVVQVPQCIGGEPVVTSEPQSLSADFDRRATFTVEVESDPSRGEVVYQWRFEGADLPDEDNPVLEIDPVRPEHAGSYSCVIRNDCGRVDSMAAQLIVIPGGDGGCSADFNEDGGVDGADVEAFFAAWERGRNSADVNEDGGIDGADVETFFTRWERGGC